jgi:hypothetical protein
MFRRSNSRELFFLAKKTIVRRMPKQLILLFMNMGIAITFKGCKVRVRHS